MALAGNNLNNEWPNNEYWSLEPILCKEHYRRKDSKDKAMTISAPNKGNTVDENTLLILLHTLQNN